MTVRADMAAGLALGELAREIPGTAEIVGDPATRVTGVHQDSRRVAPGDLFVARRGAKIDGPAFAKDAVARGAAAVLGLRGTIDPTALGVPVVFVDDVVDGLAYAAAAVYGHPAFALEIVGVTGTNGKTTTTHLVRAAIDGALGRAACATVGTVGHAFGGHTIPAEHTTPDADELARVLDDVRRRGATHVAMEVSSHALALGRVRAVQFKVGALTNLTQDHLDFHGSMAEYAAAKTKLFTDHAPGAAVVNVDDPFGRVVAAAVRAPLVRVSALGAGDADVAPLSLTTSARGIEMRVRTPAGPVDIASKLVGAHNVDNLLLALGIAHALDLDVACAAAALGGEAGAPGRLERCDGGGDDVIVLVDYAHTPDALVRALDGVRPFSQGKVWCVFGCGGDRDRAKRAPMGEAVGARADVAVLTSDNPRTEDPAAIAAAVEPGLRAGGMRAAAALGELGAARGAYAVEIDRAKAIAGAIDLAAPGDVVLVAGKGHEDYQIVGTERRAFDDRIEAKRALAARRARALGAGGGVTSRGPRAPVGVLEGGA